ncbi:MAG: hypothetical protein RL026_1921 [Pseudomonadota bacterium]
MLALDRKLLRDLWRQRGAVASIALVLACGVAAFQATRTAHDSLARAREHHYAAARFAHLHAGVRRAPLAAAEALRELPDVVDVQAGVVARAQLRMRGETGLSAQVLALPRRGRPSVDALHLVAGAWPGPGDRRGVLVHAAFATTRGLKPGDTLQLQLAGRAFEGVVRGVVLSPAHVVPAAYAGLVDQARFGVFWIPRQEMDAALDMQGSFNQVAVLARRGADLPALRAAVARRLERWGGEGVQLRAEHPSEQLLRRELREQRIYGLVFPALLLAVALFLLQVILARHLATEQLQLGALRALGYGRGALWRHYLAFVLAIVLAGALAGGLLGAWLGRLMADLYRAYFHLLPQPEWPAWDAWLLATVAAALSALLSVQGSLRRLLRRSPAEVLRPAAAGAADPVRTRTAEGPLASPAAPSPRRRMIERSLLRRPWRTALTTFGIASGMALLLAGSWWGDAFDALLHEEFGLRERADVVLTLDEPRPRSAVLHEARRLPGVLQADASRELPVELRHGARRLTLALTGLPEDARLHPALDAAQRPLWLPPGTLLLPTPAATALRLVPGDRVWVDPLQGQRPGQWLRVGAPTGDLAGRVAYAALPLVETLAGTPGVNTLRLRIDPLQHGTLFQAVADLPRVAGAGDKPALIADFRRSTADMLLTFTAILTAFATVIAVGIVYNTARIALAEQGRDLATLRVLGFRRGEVGALLLWPLALQVLCALPLGALLGQGLAALLVALIAGEDLRIPLVILPSRFVYAGAITLAAAAASAWIVRRRIDRLDLVAVLKTRD